MVQKERQSFTKPVGQWPIILAVAITLATGAVSFYGISQLRSTSRSPELATPKGTLAISDVGALGRLEPQGEVIHLSAPASLKGAQVAQLLVHEGSRVRAGEVVAILDSHDLRLAALEQAQKGVQVAQSALAQVRAGAKAGDLTAQEATIARLKAELRGEITAQEATIARLKAELRNSQTENRRYQQLYQDGAISASDSDSRRLRVETVQQQLNEAKATMNRTVDTTRDQLSEAKARLRSIAEVRTTDVQAAQAEVDSAKAAVKEAQANLALTYVRAPKDSQILKIHTWPGESISSSGIAELGQTNQMYVVAEIYETDIQKVRLGQSATITSQAFSGELPGTVTEVGLRVSKQNIFDVNPTINTDQKVIEVKIRLNELADSMRVAGLSDLQVQVVIHI